MIRFVLAAGLVAAAASAADAGYIVVRILLDGSGGGAGGGAGPVGIGPGGGGGAGGVMPLGKLPGGGGQPGGFGGPDPRGGAGGGAPFAGVAGAARPPSDPTRSIFVVVPFTDKPGGRAFYPRFGEPNPQFNPYWGLAIKHPYGYTNLFVDNSTVQAYYDLGPASPGVTKTRQSVVLAKHAAWKNKPGDTQVLLDLVVEALQYGMVGKAVQYADELVAAAGDPKAATPPPVRAFVSAYGKLQRPLKAPPSKPGDGPEWVRRFNESEFRGAQFADQGHFTLVYWDASDQDRARRLAQLEDNFRAFFLWHATRGVALPVPEKPLLAVLPKTATDTVNLGRSLDHFPAVADGFYVPEYDILVIAPERLDEVGRTFTRQLQQIYRGGASRQRLLDANTRPVPVPVDTAGQTPNSKRPEEVALMMTFAMADVYAAEATELQAVSREGSRQLLYATGLLPRHVTLPQWLSGGSVGFYTRPRGPVFTTRDDGEKEKSIATVAVTTGYGVPNFVRQKQFRDLVERRELNADPGATLRNVVTDAYFTAIADRADADDPRFPRPKEVVVKKEQPVGGIGRAPDAVLPPDPAALERKRLEFLRDKAYATAWALYYHLATNHPDGLARYTEELARLPRDLPLDETTRLILFARAFNLSAGPTAQAGQQTFAQFAQEWLRAMDRLPPAGVDIELAEPVPPSAAGPGNPAGMPGGLPPGFGGSGGAPGSGDN